MRCSRVLLHIVLPPILLMAGARGAESFELDTIETEDMRLLYIDPLQTYLTPHTARSFHNSLEFQRYIFDWTPYDDQTVVMLQDFSDSGNAAATAAPVNTVWLDVAPPSHTYETLPGSERIYSALNHELVHVANLDAWNNQDKKWRRFFGGKPRQTDKHPETIIYNYLATPRMNVPRWYVEGAAVFMETRPSLPRGRGTGIGTGPAKARRVAWWNSPPDSRTTRRV